MEILFDKINIALLVTAVLNFILGLLIIYSGRNRRVSRVYFLNIIAIIGWIMAMFFYRSASTSGTALFWCTILYVIPTIVASSFLYFTYIFPSQEEKNIILRALVIFGINFLVILSIVIPGLTIREVNIIPGEEHEIIFSSVYVIYFIYTLCFFSFGFLRLFKKILKNIRSERNQILYLLMGYSLAANLAFVTNLVMPWAGYFWLNWLGQVLTVLMVGFTAYAIVAHRLMDVRLVMRGSSVYFSSVFSIIVLASATKILLSFFVSKVAFWVDLLILIVAISIFPKFKDYFFRIANKYFFSSLYDSQKVIAEVSDKLRMMLDVEKVYDFIYLTLEKTFHTKTFAVISYDKEKKEYSVQYNRGIKIKKNDVFVGNDFLHRYFTEQNKSIVVEEVRNIYYNKKTKKTIDLLTKLNVDILTPLNVKDKTIGLLVLGPKESGDMYNDEDMQVLEIIGAQAAVSIENSQLYSEVKEFNEKLEQKVEDATIELRSTNSELKDMNEKLVTAYEKLHQLDRAKTEFISIASHQLRTPLTSIKGFISLLLDGTYGRIPKVTRDVLEKVFISNERLIKLVEDLLNISRIESGKLVFRFEKNDITKLAKDVVDSFELAAKNKKLKLEYRAPKKKIPAIYFDNDKMREVISNLVDNSIKYTKKGTVGVTVEELDNQVRVIVSDSGMGIAKEEIRYIFEKFQRGKDSSTTHTEGVGLGLYVCEKIINSHNGKIWAESDGLEKGSRFIIGLNIDFIPEDSLKVIGKEGGKK